MITVLFTVTLTVSLHFTVTFTVTVTIQGNFQDNVIHDINYIFLHRNHKHVARRIRHRFEFEFVLRMR